MEKLSEKPKSLFVNNILISPTPNKTNPIKYTKHTLVKKTISAVFSVCFLFLFASAQTQSRLWSIPPKTVTFPAPTTPPLPISGSGYDGITTSNFANNAMHDPNGNLLFFINDGIVYDRNGVLIGQIVTPSIGFIAGTTEWTIVPVPGGCTKYYLIGGFYDFLSSTAGAFPQPYYIILDLSLINSTTNAHGDFIGADVNNNQYQGSSTAFPLIDPQLQSSFAYALASTHASNMHFAITPLRSPSILYPDPNGSRFLYINNLIGGLVDRFLITSTGISYETNFLFNGGNTDLFGSARAEMEIVKISDISDPHFGNYRLALPYQTDGPTGNNRVLVVDLDFATGNIIPSIPAFPNPKYIALPTVLSPAGDLNRAEAHGIEFSADGKYLYVTHTQAPYVEFANLSVLTPTFAALQSIPTIAATLLSPQDFQYSQIELGNDGWLYFAGNNIANTNPRLAALDLASFPVGSPIGKTWSDLRVPNVIVPISTGTFDVYNAPGQPSQDVWRIRLLNDQVDGEIYQAISTSSHPSGCCTINTVFTKDNYTATSSNPAPFNTTVQTWTPTSNPFGGTTATPVATVTIRNTLTIPAGFTIKIIGMTFQFAPRISNQPNQTPGGNVIVERKIIPATKGGTLILDNSTFTSYDACGGGMWEGIQVRGYGGNSPLTQGTTYNNSAQGWLIVQNNSVIANAFVGAIAVKYATSFPAAITYDVMYAGGVIQAVNSTFENNQTAVSFMPFSEPTNPLRNKSYFTKCNFLTTALKLNDNAALFRNFVIMFGTNGIVFKGNNFENSRPVQSNQDITDNGIGIFSFNAGFSVVPFCITFNCSGFTKNTFKNLGYGIQTWLTNSLTPVKIDQTDFTGNFRGVLLNYANYSSIINNSFKVLKYNSQQTFGASYGLYLNNCTGYQVEANDFAYSTGIPNPPPPDGTYGIIVSNSGANNNLIYRNTFHQIYIGCQAQRVNCYIDPNYATTGNPPNDHGLKFKCNLFDPNAIDGYDIVEPNGCMDYHQGYFNPSNPSASANNSFSQRNDGIHWDYYLDPQTITPDPYTGLPFGVAPINYVYPTGASYIPVVYTTNKVGLTSSGVAPSCLSQITGCAYCPQNAIASAMQQKNYLLGLIDSEQTAYLISSINSSMASGQLRNLLLASSPYLSDAVLIALVNNTSLPNEIVKDVLVANSRLRPAVMAAIQNRSPQFSNEIMNNINAAQIGISPMDILLGQISEAQNTRDLAIDELIRGYLYDTTLTNGLDSVQLALKLYGVTLEEKCMLAAAQVTAKDYVGATLTLDTIRILNGGTLDNSCKLLELLIRLEQSPKSYFSIKADSTFASDSVAVSQMASNELVEAYVGAQAIMKAIFLVSFQEPIDPVPHNSLRIAQPVTDASIPELGKIYPNPNNGTMSFSYELPIASKGMLVLYDISGRQVDRFILKEGQNIEQISEEQLESGIYFFQYLVNGERINSGRIAIVK